MAFLCDDFERATIPGGRIPWTTVRANGGVIVIGQTGATRRLVSQVSLAEDGAEIQVTKPSTIGGRARFTFTTHYEVTGTTSGPSNSTTELASVFVASLGAQTRFYINPQGLAALSLDCTDCQDQDLYIEDALTPGLHTVVITTTFVGAGGEASFKIDANEKTTNLVYPALPTDADVTVKIGARHTSGRTGTVTVSYEDVMLTFEAVP
jgi:hypothetical protein